MTGVVTEWRKGSNLLKVKSVTGIIRENQSIEGIAAKFPKHLGLLVKYS